MPATLQDLHDWYARDLGRWGKFEDCAFIHEVGNGRRQSPTIRFSIYTDTNEYRISASEKSSSGGSKGYLGCTSKCRKPRAGEDWQRGNDLPDGPLSEETWREILAAIVSYELVRVHKTEVRALPDSSPAKGSDHGEDEAGESEPRSA